MKRSKPFNIKKVALGFAATALLFLSGCAVTPHANIGMDLNYYNGGFHLQPNAHVGLYGRPK